MITGMMLFFDALEEYSGLTNEQFGNLIRAGLVYARDGTEPNFSPGTPESFLFPGLRLKITRDQEKYREKCEKNAENIRKRWEQQRERDTTEYDRIPSNTDVYESYQQQQQQQQQEQHQHQQQQQQQQKARAELLREGYTESEIDYVLKKTDTGKIRNLKQYIKAAIEGSRAEAKKNQQYEQRDYSEPTENADDVLQRLEEMSEKGKGK